MVAPEPEELLADSLEVDRGFAGCGFVEREFVGTVRALRAFDPRDGDARELGTAHELDDPPDLGAGHRGRQALARRRPDDVGRARRPGVVDEVEWTGAGYPHRHEARPVGAGWVHDEGRARNAVDLGRQRLHRRVGHDVAEVARFLVPHGHGVHHVVGAARTGGVVRAVEHELPPGDLEQRVGIVGGREEQRGEGLGAPLDRAFRRRAELVDVDAIRRDAHEHVGPRARAQLAALATATTRPSDGWGGRWSEPFMRRIPPPGRRAPPSSSS